MGGKKAPSAKQKAAEKEKEQREQIAKRNEDAAWESAGEGKKSKAQAKKASKDEERQDAQAKKLEARRLADEEAAALAASSKKPAGAQKVCAWVILVIARISSSHRCVTGPQIETSASDAKAWSLRQHQAPSDARPACMSLTAGYDFDILPVMVQMTKFELDKQATADKERAKRDAAEKDKQSRRDVDEGTYAQLVETKAENTLDGVDARNVDQALSQLGIEECALPLNTQ